MGNSHSGDGKIREAIVNGIFYPAEEEQLEARLRQLLGENKTKESDAFAVISPHAGYNYAGTCIASAFRSARKRKIRNIVILAPVHNDPKDQIILPESKYFLTPIGAIEVNKTLVDELLECSTAIDQNDIPHLGEHCIEVQLPFMRYLFPDAKLVPILLGKPSERNIKVLANALQLTFSHLYHETLFIATANLTSYIEGKGSEQEAELFLSLIESNDTAGIIQAMQTKKISSCGAGCVAALLSFRKIQYRIEVLNRNSSMAANNDAERLVHYAAIALNID